MQPLVSIIIPTFNRAHLIGETLDSVLAQTYTNWECIVVDDGSTDYTAELLAFYTEKDSRIIYKERPKNMPKGANSCRNYGFEVSEGEFINWFDSDDIMLPSFLLRKIENLEKDDQFIVSRGYCVNASLQEKRLMNFDRNYELFKGLILGKIIMITDSILFRKQFLVSKRLFEPGISRGQETEFFSRIFFQIDAAYKFIEEALFLYRQHPETKSTLSKEYNQKFKESEAFIASENLKRSLILEDRELIKYYYVILMSLFFKALDKKHYKNAKLTRASLLSLLRNVNVPLLIKFKLLSKFLLVTERSSYRIGKFFRETRLYG